MASTISTVCSNKNGGILTEREVEVLRLVIEGRSSKEVAQTLFLSKRTVDFHLSKIYEKLKVSNRIQAIRRATELGLITPVSSSENYVAS